ncbi:hypothetical protein LB572_27945 [Mesorhizobium sp. BH1-1-5]|uniref:hypothetical protein n=1 Tax=unclassified Mesorhizobium TaxID=325217 RepID=UPI0015E44821|nr:MULTISPECIES: hypothetical protein [unclassified Mesorhizobium]MBZ9990941.1 hypothetical protein [Mesorhizobium sp. BH1-1-5]
MPYIMEFRSPAVVATPGKQLLFQLGDLVSDLRRLGNTPFSDPSATLHLTSP